MRMVTVARVGFVAMLAIGCGQIVVDKTSDSTPAPSAPTGGGGASSSAPSSAEGEVERFTVRGNAHGISSVTVLRLSSGALKNDDLLTLTGDGPFAFAKTLPVGATYTVYASSPDGGPSTCSFATQQLADGGWSNGQPMVVMPVGSEADDIALYCDANTYTVSASVSGLEAGKSLTAFNQGAHVMMGDNATYAFPQRFATGSTWFINITTQPDGQTCTVSPQGGTIAGADVVADITCAP